MAATTASPHTGVQTGVLPLFRVRSQTAGVSRRSRARAPMRIRDPAFQSPESDCACVRAGIGLVVA